MPKREWSQEERKAFGERMRAIREGKQTATEPKLKIPNVPRLPEVSLWRWQQHLKDNGFEVPNE